MTSFLCERQRDEAVWKELERRKNELHEHVSAVNTQTNTDRAEFLRQVAVRKGTPHGRYIRPSSTTTLHGFNDKWKKKMLES